MQNPTGGVQSQVGSYVAATVLKWGGRYVESGLGGLEDDLRPGRLVVFCLTAPARNTKNFAICITLFAKNHGPATPKSGRGHNQANCVGRDSSRTCQNAWAATRLLIIHLKGGAEYSVSVIRLQWGDTVEIG